MNKSEAIKSAQYARLDASLYTDYIVYISDSKLNQNER